MPTHASIVDQYHFFFRKMRKFVQNAIYLYSFGEKSEGIHFFPQKYTSESQKILGKREILAEISRLLVYIF